MASKLKGSSHRILHNSFWYGLETILETIVFLGTSIAVARYLGPAKLGYFSYINFFVMIVTRTSGTGLSTATRKYMSEFIALDRMGTARAVYNLAHRYQLIGAVSITALGLAGTLIFGDPHYRLMSSILILAIIPGLMSWVPAQANQALQDVSNNTLSAFGYIAVYASIIGLTLHFHWDLVGIAAASLIGRTVEVFLRTIPLNAKLRQLPLDSLESDIVRRIRRFCIQAVGIQLLMSVVWDRSEMVFLRAFSTLEQTAFYSISFTLANNLLMFPRIFGSATGIALMAEAIKDPKRVDSIVRNSCRYLLLIVLPVNLGAAAITLPAINLAYGARYLGAVPVLMIASIMAIPRAFQGIPELLIRTGDLQNRLLVWYGLTGIVNIALDYFLIPRYGAVGAAWGNGLSQSFGVIVIWLQATRFYAFSFPMQSAIRLFFASSIMAVVAFFVSHAIPGLPGPIIAVLMAIPVYIVLLKLFHGLDSSDRIRLMPIGNRLPRPVRHAYLATLKFITPATT
jgi:O-antigen/teichoic acid export membrane protein